MKTALLIILCIMLILTGIGIGRATVEPIVQIREVPVVTEVVHYVDKPPIIETVEVLVEMVCGIKVSQTLGKHMGLMVIIGNEVFFQDTYPPYKLIKFANRD